MRKHFNVKIGFSILGCGLLLCVSSASAATANPSGQALEIAPPILTLTANPGQTLKTSIELRDVSASSLVVTNQVNDFVAAGEDGSPQILTGDTSNDPFSMKDWIQPLQALTLVPKEIETLPVTINVPASASPGGHYSIIRFTGTAPELKGTGVSLSASLGALVLLTVNGQLHDNLSVQEFSANDGGKPSTFFESAPITFVARLKNNGNIQEEPSGHIIVTDMFGKIVAGVNINIPPRNVLPASIRKFTGALDKSVIGNKRLFGKYKAVMSLTYGSVSKQSLTSTMSFWVIPYRLIGIIVVAILVAFFALRFLIQRYNRYILSNAHRRR